jgi:hypothetical protein
MSNQDINAVLAPLLSGNLAQWQGLPVISAGDLEAALGQAAEHQTANLGAYPAERLRFPQRGDRTLLAYVRHGEVIMVEVIPPGDASALAALGEPSAILPQEISIDGAYAHEYLYARQGLLLTVAEDLKHTAPDRLVRCRGIRPLSGPQELGAELYWPEDLDVRW